MADDNLNNLVARISVADISSAIAFGLQRALDVRQETLRDKILIYGGRLDFHIQVSPQGVQGMIRETTPLEKA